MVKKILLGMFLAVVAMATTTEAAVMNFRGVMSGTGVNVGSFTLDFEVVDNGVTGDTRNGLITSARLVTGGANPQFHTFSSGTVAFLDNNSVLPEEKLTFSLFFTGGKALQFAYGGGLTTLTSSNALTRDNMYSFMFAANGPSPNGPAYSRANSPFTVAGFGGASGNNPAYIESVPEPGSMAALAFLTSGIAGFAYRRRKAKAKK